MKGVRAERDGVLGGLLVAVLATAWALEGGAARVPAPVRRALAHEEGRRLGPWKRPETLSASQWRAAPGVGRRRATDLVEARWSARPGEPWRWWEVPGIGPTTEARVRGWLRGGEVGRARGAP